MVKGTVNLHKYQLEKMLAVLHSEYEKENIRLESGEAVCTPDQCDIPLRSRLTSSDPEAKINGKASLTWISKEPDIEKLLSAMEAAKTRNVSQNIHFEEKTDATCFERKCALEIEMPLYSDEAAKTRKN